MGREAQTERARNPPRISGGRAKPIPLEALALPPRIDGIDGIRNEI
jgi:hypothetical protein